MRLLGLFDRYFLALMIIQGLILVVDSKGFSRRNMKDTSKKSRFIGIAIIIISVVLHLITMYSS